MRNGVFILLIFFMFSAPGLSRAPYAAPNAPGNLMIVDVSFDYIYIRWQDNSDNEERFIIERHTEGLDFSLHDTIAVNGTSYLDSRVQTKTTYYYRVYAENAEGKSDFSNEVFTATHDLPNQPPDKPSDVLGFFDNINRNIIAWDDNSHNELKFKIFRGTNGLDFELIDSVIRDETLYYDYQIQSNQSYYYYIIAENSYGTSGPSDTAQIDVTNIIGIETPVLSLESVTATEVQLSWKSFPGNQIEYTLHRSTQTDTIPIELNDSLSYTDTGLPSNSDFSYQLKVEDSNGNISLSNIIDVTTLPWFTKHRAQDSLILFYVFSQLRNDSVPDQSWYKNPANLVLSDSAGINFADSSFLRLEEQNLLSANSCSKIIEACQASRELSIECWIKTSSLPHDGPAKILSMENQNSVAFSLSCIQDNENKDKIKYFTNLTTNTTDNMGNPDFSSEVSSQTGILQHIVYTHNKLGEELFYINGEAVTAGFRPPKYDNWEADYSLVLGNNLSGDTPWLGNYYMCAVYNRALSFDEISQNYYASPFSENNYLLNSVDYTLNVFPNPSSDEISIDFLNENPNLEVTKSYSVVLINSHGLEVKRKDISDILNIGNAKISIADLEPGLYNLILRNPYGIIDWKRIVIAR